MICLVAIEFSANGKFGVRRSLKVRVRHSASNRERCENRELKSAMERACTLLPYYTVAQKLDGLVHDTQSGNLYWLLSRKPSQNRFCDAYKKWPQWNYLSLFVMNFRFCTSWPSYARLFGGARLHPSSNWTTVRRAAGEDVILIYDLYSYIYIYMEPICIYGTYMPNTYIIPTYVYTKYLYI